MAQNPVTTGDLAARWRPLTSDEALVAEAVLEDAWAVLNAHIPGLAARMDSGTVDVSLIRAVVRSAVLRDLKNPDGVTARQRTLADYTESDQYARPTTLRGVFTDDELALIASAVNAAAVTARGAFTIRPGAGEALTLDARR